MEKNSENKNKKSSKLESLSLLTFGIIGTGILLLSEVYRASVNGFYRLAGKEPRDYYNPLDDL